MADDQQNDQAGNQAQGQSQGQAQGQGQAQQATLDQLLQGQDKALEADVIRSGQSGAGPILPDRTGNK